MAEDSSEPPSTSAGGSIDVPVLDEPRGFASLTGDFYRGELERTAAWRARLDQTTNWAVVVVAAILTWAFSSDSHPHYVILIGMFGVAAFLLMEANRYREYDIWRNRVRLLQENLFANLYAPDPAERSAWRSELGEELRDPEFNISFREALTHRLRRSYLALLVLLLAAWLARITVFEPAEPWRRTASILGAPGVVVVVAVALFYASVGALTALSVRGSRVREFQE